MPSNCESTIAHHLSSSPLEAKGRLVDSTLVSSAKSEIQIENWILAHGLRTTAEGWSCYISLEGHYPSSCHSKYPRCSA